MDQGGQRQEKRAELVRIGDVDFLIEVADSGGPQTVGLGHPLSFDGVRDTVEAIASQVVQVWDRVKPTEASVEFGLSFTTKTGNLTGLLVDAGGTAALKVTLTWKAPHLAW